MTDPLFFDTDCLSAFLWVGQQSLLAVLYPGRIVIPDEVYSELSNPVVQHLRRRIDFMIDSDDAWIESIQTGTSCYDLYRRLTRHPDSGHKIIGRGEAAAIALAKEHDGTLASNNLRDVDTYIREFGLKHVTTGDIMKEALHRGILTMDDGEKIWQEMLGKRRRLGYGTFADFLAHTYCST